MKEKIINSETLEEILSNKKYSISYYQREYRWGKKQIKQLIDDLTNTFMDSYNMFSNKEIVLDDVTKFDFYYMGTIIVTQNSVNSSIIDGQQRLTSLTLLLIAIKNLHDKYPCSDEIGFQTVDSLVFSTIRNVKSFNLNVVEWVECLHALWNNKTFNLIGASESVKNLCNRYNDIIDLLEEEFDDKDDDENNENKGKLISFFGCWLIYQLTFIKIITPNEQDAHKVFVSMNDRGLRLNASEMLKGYLLSQIREDDKRNKCNDIWKSEVLKIKESSEKDSGGEFNTEDVEFLSIWLRAKYARKIRGPEKNSKDEDYEIITREFHEWVRENHQYMGLKTSEDFYNFINRDFRFFARVYLNLKSYANTYNENFKEVFFNANKELNYQYVMILASLNADDSDEVVNKKIKMISTYIDIYSTKRIVNYVKLGWNTSKRSIFPIILKIRELSNDLSKLTVYLTFKLTTMENKITALSEKNFAINHFSKGYILHILARLLDFVETSMGKSSQFSNYVDRNVNNPYDKEHILSNDYSEYANEFETPEIFEDYRERLGNLLILHSSVNRSLQDKNFAYKREEYLKYNILAKTLNEKGYSHEPRFEEFCKINNLNFKPYFTFGKNEITERQNLYQQIALLIWDDKKIRKISGVWDKEFEEKLIKENTVNQIVVDIFVDDNELLVGKKVTKFKILDKEFEVSAFNELVVKVINILSVYNADKFNQILSEKTYDKRLIYKPESNIDILMKEHSNRGPKKVNLKGLFVITHGGYIDLCRFLRNILNDFNISSLTIYVK